MPCPLACHQLWGQWARQVSWTLTGGLPEDISAPHESNRHQRKPTQRRQHRNTAANSAGTIGQSGLEHRVYSVGRQGNPWVPGLLPVLQEEELSLRTETRGGL